MAKKDESQRPAVTPPTYTAAQYCNIKMLGETSRKFCERKYLSVKKTEEEWTTILTKDKLIDPPKK